MLCVLHHLRHAGWGVGVQVHLLHQLQHGDVVIQGPGGGGVALVVHDALHLHVLENGGVCRGGKVVLPKSHL